MTVLWEPDPEHRAASLLTRFARGDRETAVYAQTFDYRGLHVWSLAHREAFWSRLWNFCEIIGEKGESVLVDGGKMPGARWFPEAQLNFAQNVLRPRPDADIAIVFQGEGQERRALAFGALKRQVGALAAYLQARGVGPGDRVAAYLHNGPEAIVGMLAAASLGAVWSSCSPDFGVAGVLDRFGQIEPKALIACDGYFYKGQACDRLAQTREIAAGLPTLQCVLVAPYLKDVPPLSDFPNAESWRDALAAHDDAPLRFALLPFDHPLYVVFSSGTTGAPKCIVHGAGGTLLQHMKEHQLHCDIHAGDRVFYATTTGWMMWNWLASALASRATILLYDGFPMDRDGAALFDFAESERATILAFLPGLLPCGAKARRRTSEDPRFERDATAHLDGFAAIARRFRLWSTGKSRPESQLCLDQAGAPIFSPASWLGNPSGPSVRRGEIQGGRPRHGRRSLGGRRAARLRSRTGELVCTQAFPSMPIGFWNDVSRRKNT